MSTETLWAYGRASGAVDLLLFALAVVLGILATSGRPFWGLARTTLTRLHRTVSVAALLFLLVHVVTLVLDPFAKLSWLDAVLPFANEANRWGYGLGAVALDLVLVVALSGMLRRTLPHRAFFWMHLGAYVMYPVAVAHVLFSGTDRGSWWILLILSLGLAAVVASFGWRLSPGFRARRAARARGHEPGVGAPIGGVAPSGARRMMPGARS